MDMFDREMKDLEERHQSGEISTQEFNREVRELELDYEAAAEEAAHQAYNEELGRWRSY